MGRPKKGTKLDELSPLLEHAAVEVLDDGRVEARLSDHPERPVKEMLARTTQAEAAKFIFNDLGPQALEAIREE